MERSPSKTGSIAQANNSFALNLYSHLRENRENVSFSPSSLFMALAMIWEGARGKTAEEMRSVLSFPRGEGRELAALGEKLNRSEGRYQIHTANALWLQEGLGLLPEYVKTVEEQYGSKGYPRGLFQGSG
ncbi:MAG TPA: hypothetical protein ENM97_08220, partial [Moorella mulderi]|nr:hypothetical protein [Moorella mulderi]